MAWTTRLSFPRKTKSVCAPLEYALAATDKTPVIASLTARANAVRMLHSRIQLLRSYLYSLPPSYLTGESSPEPTSETASQAQPEINHVILRSIQALINRLPLLVPADRAAFEQQALAEKNDVSLVAMLGGLSRSLKDARELGRKFGIVDHARSSAKKSAVGDDFFASMNENAQKRGIVEEGYALS